MGKENSCQKYFIWIEKYAFIVSSISFKNGYQQQLSAVRITTLDLFDVSKPKSHEQGHKN